MHCSRVCQPTLSPPLTLRPSFFALPHYLRSLRNNDGQIIHSAPRASRPSSKDAAPIGHECRAPLLYVPRPLLWVPRPTGLPTQFAKQGRMER